MSKITEGRIMRDIEHYFEDPMYRKILLAKNKKELSKAIFDMKLKHGEIDISKLLKLLNIKETKQPVKFLPLLRGNA